MAEARKPKNNNDDKIRKILNDINAQADVNEAYLVGLLWSNPEKYYGKYAEILKGNHFIKGNWGFFYSIGQDLYKDGALVFDDITVIKKLKAEGLEEKFEEHGGFNVLDDVIGIVKNSEGNIDYYADAVLKNFTIRQLYELFGKKVLINTSDYNVKEMSRDELIMHWSSKMNDIAVESSTNNYETENLYIDADEFLKKLEEDGDEMLAFSRSTLWNSISQGVPRGAVTMFGGFGNSGKSSITADKFTMACIEEGERLIVVLNEEDAQAYRQKILLSLLWREGIYIDRKALVKGNLPEKEKDKIRLAFSKLSDLMNGDESQIKVIFMERYIMSDLEKIIRSWANKGYTNLLIDTHKVSDDSKHNARWETFVEDMKTIYRITRKNAGGCNLRTLVTFQLADSAIRNRFLDFDAIGEGKGAKNEASNVFMFRAVWGDEYEGGSHELTYYTLHKQEDGRYRKEANQVLQKQDNKGNANIYYLLFTAKNRTGSTNATGQDVLILKAEFHANRFREIGWTQVLDDKASRR